MRTSETFQHFSRRSIYEGGIPGSRIGEENESEDENEIKPLLGDY
jgi:hypothetical protein